MRCSFALLTSPVSFAACGATPENHILDLYQIVSFDSRCKESLSSARTPRDFGVAMAALYNEFGKMFVKFSSEDARNKALRAREKCRDNEWAALQRRSSTLIDTTYQKIS
jgi:hypothetical protein